MNEAYFFSNKNVKYYVKCQSTLIDRHHIGIRQRRQQDQCRSDIPKVIYVQSKPYPPMFLQFSFSSHSSALD
ncbi:unnamed protein product [Citrullus colocynthis]|uniref:Uncharacterized protein n=1 Tax=Citrullus colocynthis TaxID=252529 RepID=A0ABP0YQL2_9ROSI